MSPPGRSLTKSVACDQSDGREWEIGDCCKQGEEPRAVGSRVGVRFVQFQALKMRSQQDDSNLVVILCERWRARTQNKTW